MSDIKNPAGLDGSREGIAVRLSAIGEHIALNQHGMNCGTWYLTELVDQVEAERKDAFESGLQLGAHLVERVKAERAELRDRVAELEGALSRAQGLAQDLTGIIGVKCQDELRLAEQIAAALAPQLEADTSDMDLPELVAALIDFALGEHAREQAISMEPEDAPGVFLVLNADGRITGPIHKSDRDARAWAQQYRGSSSSFTVVRRVATCTTRIETDWKEG